MNKTLFILLIFAFYFTPTLNQEVQKLQSPTCSSTRVISLTPKTLKYHNDVNNTKQLTCKSNDLPQFISLDDRCYLIVSPLSAGEFSITINMTISQKKGDDPVNVQLITVPYVLQITKIRYKGLSDQEVQFDISLNRVISIQTQSTSWLLKPGQQFFTQFNVNQTSTIYERLFYQFINLPNGLKGSQLTGVVQGTVDVPLGYYSFSVRVFDFQGNSQTLQVTILVHQQNDAFEPEDYEDQETLKSKLTQLQQKSFAIQATVNEAKAKIQATLIELSSLRSDQSNLGTQRRKLQGTQGSLSYAATWAKGNLQSMKNKSIKAQTVYNDTLGIVNEAKRAYQTSVFAINEKQSQIQKQQLEGDRRFQMYLNADKKYTQIRIQLDGCEQRNKQIADEAMSNLKDLDAANFVQNLQDIIKNN